MVILSFLWVSCQNNESTSDEQKTESVKAVAQKLDINKFDEQVEGLANKLVEVTGTCMHTCSHGGTKMFLSGDNPDFRLKIMATDESGNFNQEMEGKDFVVVGILDEYRMDMAELDKMEADVLAEYGVDGDEHSQKDLKHKGGEHMGGAHKGKGGEGKDVEHQEAEGSCEAELNQISNLRAKVKASGKGYLSFYSVLAQTYEEVKK